MGGTGGTITADLGTEPLVGMNTVSYSANTTLTAEFDDFSVCGVEEQISFRVNCSSTGQLCDPPYATHIETGKRLKVRYDVPSSHCGSGCVSFFLDGTHHFTSPFLGWDNL